MPTVKQDVWAYGMTALVRLCPAASSHGLMLYRNSLPETHLFMKYELLPASCVAL